MPEIPRKSHSSYVFISLAEFLDLMPGGIRRAIIDEDDLIMILVMKRLEYGKELTIDIGDILLFTICRDDYRENLMRHERRRKDESVL